MAEIEHMTRDANILVVDDDREIRTMLSAYLTKNGFSATAVADGEETRRALPHESGLKICRELRSHSEIPIIMLTALGEEVDRVVGLEVGADDYMAKPFSPRELLGRIRAVLRRTSGAQKRSDVPSIREYRFSDWTRSLEERLLRTPNGETVELTGAEFGLLSILLGRAPRVVSRTDLMPDLHGREPVLQDEELSVVPQDAAHFSHRLVRVGYRAQRGVLHIKQQ